jgi:arginyl-tRNA--protein-N-Asp/Glu arginylyltransferase
MERLQFYLTTETPCPYLPDRDSANIVPDPMVPVTSGIYDQLIQHGFRRSGDHVYRPHCPQCSACIPIRIPVQAFKPRRTDRRLLNSSQDIQTHTLAAGFHEEHFALFQRYTAKRHPEGGMATMGREEYIGFLSTSWGTTWFTEFRLEGQLIAVAIYDQVRDGLSAVYTFFDPDLEKHAPGRLAILWQIEEARRLGLPNLYLGYWIAESPKMAYKANYHPVEKFYDGRWVRE